MPAEINSTDLAHITGSTTLIPAINAWQYYLNDQGRSIHTVKAFIADLRLLAGFMAPDRTISSISTQDLDHFLDWLKMHRGVPCSPKSYSRRITSLKAFFRWLHQGGVIAIDPAEKIVQQTVISPLPTVLTNEEIDLLTRTAQKYRQQAKPDARPYVLFKLLLETGIKKGECLGIDVNHIDTDNTEQPTLFVRYNSPRNRFKERKILLSREWAAALKEYLVQYQPKNQLFPWSPRRLEYILEDLSKEAGIGKHLSFDMCRWTSGIHDLQTEVDSDEIRQKMGVSKIQWREISLKLRRLAE
jgi:integrase/recombinase XerD